LLLLLLPVLLLLVLLLPLPVRRYTDDFAFPHNLLLSALDRPTTRNLLLHVQMQQDGTRPLELRSTPLLVQQTSLLCTPQPHAPLLHTLLQFLLLCTPLLRTPLLYNPCL
jgi:hypothetical protein